MKGQFARSVSKATFSPRFPKTIVPLAGYPAVKPINLMAHSDKGELTPG